MNINKLMRDTIPKRLLQIAESPKQLFVIGADLQELLSLPSVAIVGSRKVETRVRMINRHRCFARVYPKGRRTFMGTNTGQRLELMSTLC